MIDLRQGDALELLQSIPSDSVHLVATDPPYFKVKDEPWDRAWDNPTAFLDWLDEIVAEFSRILVPNGSLYLFASPQMAARVQVVISRHFQVLNEIVWSKPTGFYQKTSKAAQRSFFPQTERIIFAEPYGADGSPIKGLGYKAACAEIFADVTTPLRDHLIEERDKVGWTNRQVDDLLGTSGMSGHYFGASQWCLPKAEVYEALRSAWRETHPTALPRSHDDLLAEYEKLRTEYERRRESFADLRRPFELAEGAPNTDVWEYPVATVRGMKRHPCAKPVEMMEHIIRTSTRTGELVCDPFLGGGSTAVAAHNLGRDFIGGDALAEWVEYTTQRLDD